jgi:Mce-associated membrane protein
VSVHTAQSDTPLGDTLSDTAIDDDAADETLEPNTDTAEAASDTDAVGGQRRRRRSRQQMSSSRRWMLVAGSLMIAALTGLTAWLGWNVHQQRLIADQRAAFLQAARQGAVNLSTIDWQHAEPDVQRIVNSATGTFYDEFSKRSQSFIDVVKQSQTKSEGTIVAAGLESESDSDAQVLVAMNVKIFDAPAADQPLRSWRMRISVHKVDDQVKVSNVEFVP